MIDIVDKAQALDAWRASRQEVYDRNVVETVALRQIISDVAEAISNGAFGEAVPAEAAIKVSLRCASSEIAGDEAAS